MESDMKNTICCLIVLLFVLNGFGQDAQPLLRKGNMLYKQKDFDKSLSEYQKALAVTPDNPVAQYNFGNVLFRKQQYTEAELAYSKAVEHASEKTRKENA